MASTYETKGLNEFFRCVVCLKYFVFDFFIEHLYFSTHLLIIFDYLHLVNALFFHIFLPALCY